MAATMTNQSPSPSGTVRNTDPPNWTSRMVPAKITAAIITSALLPARLANADWLRPRHRALNRFQNCNITNTAKKTDNSRSVTTPSRWT